MKTIEQQYEIAERTLSNDKDLYAGHDLAIFGMDLDGDLFYKGYASEHTDEEGNICWCGTYDTHDIMFNEECELTASRSVSDSIVILEA